MGGLARPMAYIHRHLTTPLKIVGFTIRQFVVGIIWGLGLLFFGGIVLSPLALLFVWLVTIITTIMLGIFQRRKPEGYLRNVVIYTIKRGTWHA